MPRPRNKKRDLANTAVVFGRLSRTDYERLEKTAERMNMTRAGLTRYLLLKGLEALEAQLQPQ